MFKTKLDSSSALVAADFTLAGSVAGAQLVPSLVGSPGTVIADEVMGQDYFVNHLY